MPTLHWIGKEKIISHHQEVPYRVLNHQYGFTGEGQQLHDTHSGNKIIHGDNLNALKALLPQYEGKVKCIYIDPPYNTGNEGWLYNDNVNDPTIKKWLEKTLNARRGGKDAAVGLDDLTRHDKWLCMMYPRLQLLHKLLAKDGAIFISIDDNEVAALKLVMDEIFGAWNFVANVIWQKAFSPVNLRKTFSSNHDFILVYCKDPSVFTMNGLQRKEEDLKRYKNPDNDVRGPWTSSDLTVGPVVDSKLYGIQSPSGKTFTPPHGRCWVLTQDRYEELLKDGRIWFGEKQNSMPRQKKFLSEVKPEITPMTVWLHQDVGNNQDSKKEIKAIFPESRLPFDTPKPSLLIERILEIGTDKNAIILDSFAGSGTTAHAVLNLNKQDGGNRQFILVEIEDYADTITAERVKRVIQGYGNTEGTGGSFDYYTLGETLFDEDDNLNANIDLRTIREYIWYSETRSPLYTTDPGSAYLGKHNGTGYYFMYSKEAYTTLDYEALAGLVQEKADRYVIYADNCLLDESFTIARNIEFKKIPRDISRL